MNYYEETKEKIIDLIEKEEYEEAKRLIKNELELSYVPRDFEEDLIELLNQIDQKTFRVKSLSEEEIEEYLKKDENHQLLAVDALDKRNLRDEIYLCQDYLGGKGFKNAKALLIDSLIRQQIDHVFILKDEDQEIQFNPSKLVPLEESDVYKECNKSLEERFLKEPSMLVLGKQLLYKEMILSLPLLPDKAESEQIAERIEDYIRKAFE
ncbi:MAG: DUF3196 family protein [Erysipelotrichaceae bacterium]|nr:DUF3196 family protein [Erysipelotrichaceae bacterium]